MDKTRQKAANTTSNSRTQSERMQATNTKHLMDRNMDIEAWRRELKSMIVDVTSETEALLTQKNKLEAALKALEVVG